MPDGDVERGEKIADSDDAGITPERHFSDGRRAGFNAERAAKTERKSVRTAKRRTKKRTDLMWNQNTSVRYWDT